MGRSTRTGTERPPSQPTDSRHVRGIDVGLIVSIAIAVGGVIYYVGRLEGRVASLERGTSIQKQVEDGLQTIQAAIHQAHPGADKTNVLISASKLWVDTGVDLTPGEHIHLRASGLVNLAIHRAVLNADKNLPPSLPWTGPEGILQLPRDKPLYVRRQELLVFPGAYYGTLLLYVQQPGEPIPEKYNACPTGIQVVGKELQYTYPKEAKGQGRLFLTVNDTVLKPDLRYRASFVGTQDELDKTYGRGRYTVAGRMADWEKLVKDQYWEKWFDDNGGAFLVEISR